MRTKHLCRLGLVVLASFAILAAAAETPPIPKPSTPIPMDRFGAVAGEQYQGEGLAVVAAPDGVRLRCAFQRLEGVVTREGLWLSSTANSVSDERFQVGAVRVGRNGDSELWWSSPLVRPQTLPIRGDVSFDGQTAKFVRDGLTEEYSVSVDGVRQDFIIEKRPDGEGDLCVDLNVTGATAASVKNGARLTLNGSGRRLMYSRLHVTDAHGRELMARIEVRGRERLAVVVNDSDAVYPIRIDPTFSDENWVSLGGIPGTDSRVQATAVDASGNLYIGGTFLVVGNVAANRIAKWNGTNWSALGSGMNDIVYSIAVSGDDVYAGGQFTMAGGGGAARVAKWNGSSWSALGSGMNNNVFSLSASGSEVYVGGQFTTAGTNSARYIAKWNGSSWTNVGGGVNGIVNGFARIGSDLYAAGAFTTATNLGGAPVTVHYIARWNGNSWSALGSGMDTPVGTLAASGSVLYAGGGFIRATNSGGAPVSVNRIAKWDGSNWSALASGFNDQVYSVAVSGSEVIAGGFFLRATNAGGVTVPVNRIARWDGNAWSALGAGMNSTVEALAAFGSNVYAGGSFTTAGGGSGNYVARWDGNSWSVPGSANAGMNGKIWAIAVSGDNVFAGGEFKYAVAQWNGSTWSALGGGLNGTVLALAAVGSDLYVGGTFNRATNSGGDAVAASRLAKWNGSTWSSPGLGMNGTVVTLEASGNAVYAAGEFTRVTNTGPTSVLVNRITRWDGTNWSALGLGLDNRVDALAFLGSNVYAGGSFLRATNTGSIAVPVSRIAEWNGTNWSSLGGGLNETVLALAAGGNDIYAGGTFTRATNSGGASIATSRIAKWDGASWSGLGGVDGPVYALAASGSNVYVGGDFEFAGGVVDGENIAVWKGTNWSDLGSGMNDWVYALVLSGGNLYVGGQFTIAAGKVGYLAKVNVSGAASPGRFSNLAYSPSTGFRYTFLDGTVGQSYRIQTRTSLSFGSWVDLTNFTYTAPVVMTNAGAGSTNRFFRAITP